MPGPLEGPPGREEEDWRQSRLSCGKEKGVRIFRKSSGEEKGGDAHEVHHN